MAVFTGNGSAASPSFTFSSDTTTGFYRPNPSQMGLTFGGAQGALFSSGGLRMAFGTDGIQFNGDTAATNALDDYEEGTWTPVLNWTNVTYTLQQGKYTKIGNRVFFSINLSWTANDAAIFTTISLPFPSASVNERSTISVQDITPPANFQYPVADIFSSDVYVRYVDTSGAYTILWGVGANDAGAFSVAGHYAVP